MDEQVVAGYESQADIAAFVARYPFPIDNFQLEAIAHLADYRLGCGGRPNRNRQNAGC